MRWRSLTWLALSRHSSARRRNNSTVFITDPPMVASAGCYWGSWQKCEDDWREWIADASLRRARWPARREGGHAPDTKSSRSPSSRYPIRLLSLILTGREAAGRHLHDHVVPPGAIDEASD